MNGRTGSIMSRVRGAIARRPRTAILLYAALLIASQLTQAFDAGTNRGEDSPARRSREVPEQLAESPTDEIAPQRTVTLSAIVFGSQNDHDRPPVILLHGSPGDATNFSSLGPLLADAGRTAYALDMPGFGDSSKWVGDYSARAYARYLLAFMDELDIDRAHIVGWSNGGAVTLYACELAPSRIASATLLAAIAVQETEGSGSFFFEHAKYAVGYTAIVVLPDLVPHFGLLGPRSFRHAFIRNFWDTDQRPLRGVMESLETPTLILHGRHDPLVSDWAAERHHELIPTSLLVMTEHSHFLPVMQPALTAGYLEEHFDRHDTPGVAPRTDSLILEPPMGAPWFRTLIQGVRHIWWPLQISIVFSLAVCRRESTTAIAGLLVGHSTLDFGVAFAGLFVARIFRDERTRGIGIVKRPASLVRVLLWSALSLLIAQILLGSPTRIGESGLFVVIAAVLGVALLLHVLKHLPSRQGRRGLVVSVRRFLHHEWWPSWVLYALLIPHFARLAIRHHSLTVWTCVNPGIRPGGGIVGEPKDEILRALDPACALTQFIEPPHASRADRVESAHKRVSREGYPVVVKPEAGERGDRVTVVRTLSELDSALRSIPGPALVQRYHPGPTEVGIFWVRDPATVGAERTDAPQGQILGVTRKVFPELVCDGARTIREQILTHPRFRMQAGVLCENLGDRLGEIPPAGERIRLTELGNHAMGCRFEDGSDLVTPALAETVDRMARTWRGADGEPFDYGRFDIRSVSDASVRRGEDLAVIELNGVTSEATNLYDPSWSAARALRLLSRQWSAAFEIGAARRANGARPLGIAGIVRSIIDARRPSAM